MLTLKQGREIIQQLTTTELQFQAGVEHSSFYKSLNLLSAVSQLWLAIFPRLVDPTFSYILQSSNLFMFLWRFKAALFFRNEQIDSTFTLERGLLSKSLVFSCSVMVYHLGNE